MKYVMPAYFENHFNCPSCGALAHQEWDNIRYTDPDTRSWKKDNDTAYAHCYSCGQVSLWIQGQLVYPKIRHIDEPNNDMPQHIRNIYDEARDVSSLSPKGAAALLRLAIQELCIHLGEDGERLNDAIGNLVKKGLPVQVQQSLDIVRVIGNNAVHPGQMTINDSPTIVATLFSLVNLICSVMITQPKQISEIYASLPEGALKAIERRDSNNVVS